MSTGKADLILHPIRLKIVTELANRPKTTTEIATLLPQVARATLYRHIKLLADGGVLEVVNETNVNGAIERTYQVTEGGGRLSSEDLRDLSMADHLRYFTTFVATLIDTFAEYAYTTPLETLFDKGLAYNRAVVHLSDEERLQFQEEIHAVVTKMMTLPAAPNRRKYTLAQAVIPTPTRDEL